MNETQVRRAALREKYRGLYEHVEEILFRHDPIGINFGDNRDEYDPEVDTILPRLQHCESIDQVRDVVFEEFVRWFDGTDVGPREHYRTLAEEIWLAYLEYRAVDTRQTDADDRDLS